MSRCDNKAGNVRLTADVVICLHGFPDNIETFQHQIPLLVAAGYQVVVPVMRGYEPGSVQSDHQYFLHQIAQDIIDWMDELSISQAHIVGHDWGALTAWVMAGLAPNRMVSLTSIAIPPLGRFQQALLKVPLQLASSWYIGFFQLGKVADWAVTANDWQLIRFLWRKWSPDWSVEGETIQGVISTLSQPGVKRAALSYYRCLMAVRDPNWKQTQQLLKHKLKMPVQIIHGVNDGCIDSNMFDAAVVRGDFDEGVEVHSIEGAGHFVQLEKPLVVSRLLLEFFSK
ncbi:hypothetical protein A9Q81_08605 [Gammaproteobacteria bacterium 42_54_T18]|nr:hypothetical protein A9Q81_08605 [Gammaproteobacteria bacterium 42_54_T18]